MLWAFNERRTHLVRSLLPLICGTVVEYYDYALYGFCATLLGDLFFPSASPSIVLLQVFGVFLVGSLSKPFGSVFFGYLGDKYGREIALKISMLGIAVPTTAIAFLPTYQSIGLLAPVALLLIRMIQGMCTAGESDGVRVMIVELVGDRYPCFTNSLVGMSCLLGIYLASSISAHFVTHDTYPFAFLLGGIMGLAVFHMRKQLVETDIFKRVKNKDSLLSYRQTLIKNKRVVLAAVLLCGATGGIYHFYLVFLPHFLSTILGMLEIKEASLYAAYGILIYTIATPLAGWIADQVGPKKFLQFASANLFLVVLMNVIMIAVGCFSFYLVALTTISLAFFQAPVFVVILEHLKVRERYRCLSIGHSLGSMLFSGSAPVIALWLWQVTGQIHGVLGYILLLAGLGVLAVKIIKKSDALVLRSNIFPNSSSCR